MKYFLALVLSISLFVSCNNLPKQITIKPTSEALNYMGRTVWAIDSSVAELCWSGASVSLNFEGENLKATLKNSERDNYYNVIIDGVADTILHIDTLRKEYVLAKNLQKGKHNIQLFRRTEWTFGKTQFYGFKIEGNAKLLPADSKKKRSIEFYGNSITAGHGVDDPTDQDRWDSIYSNNYHTYASVAARHFDAQYSCIARGGIGIMVSWFNQIMPELYYRHDPTDSNSKWDFKSNPVDVVVVNLFQNDSWIVNYQEHEEYKRRFTNNTPDKKYIIKAYANFISKIRGHYPNANIVCMLGNMDVTQEGSLWPEYVEEAITTLKDDKISSFFMPYKNSEGHPKIADQKLMGEALIQHIEETIGW
ncbi:SGNH/GDSL hydrolase family protein [Labilibaculum antarcticum]|uniref:Electron transporter RnfD n=1 Tax=Labilibaculum antarcticum TaxID=1717717 RepID=A0A1Y1CDL2_9BACT|nr:SGNH/GDSL hydrolase family protein [Labilibaculum antarcticum]BAX78436.1 electron transporter RnfD [Labilibaculum antarcticum]